MASSSTRMLADGPPHVVTETGGHFGGDGDQQLEHHPRPRVDPPARPSEGFARQEPSAWLSQPSVSDNVGPLSFPDPHFSARPGRGLARIAWVVMAAIVCLAVLWPLFPSRQSQLMGVGLAYQSAGLLTALGCYMVASRTRGQAKFVWTMGALAAAVLSLAQLSWLVTLTRTGQMSSFNAPWRVGVVLAYPPVLLVLFFLTVRWGRWTALLHRFSDAVLIAGSVLVTTWVVASTVVQEQLHSDQPQVWGWVLAANLLGILLVLTLAAVCFAHRHVLSDRLSVAVAGIALLAIGDVAKTLAQLHQWQIHPGYLFTASILGLLMVAGVAFSVEGTEVTDDEPTPSLLALMLPYACLLMAMACLVVRRVMGEPPQVGESIITLLLVVAVLLRHMLTASETHRLLRALANREQVMRHQALHDPLTGLANRALFTDRVEHAVTLHARSGQGVAVMFCDLDDFKEVNDTLGHAAGDALLVAVACRMREVVRAGDTVARLGGDEFALLIEQPEAEVSDIARRLLVAISTPLNLTQAWVFPSASLGSAFLLPAHPSGRAITTAAQLLADADEAMYVAKASGKGRHASAVNGQITLTKHEGSPYDPLNMVLPVDHPPVSEDPTVPNQVRQDEAGASYPLLPTADDYAAAHYGGAHYPEQAYPAEQAYPEHTYPAHYSV